MPPRIDETRHPFEIGPWAELARNDPQAYRERQATEILLHAVGSSPAYGDRLYLKGGILMGLAYQSPRQRLISILPETSNPPRLSQKICVPR